jgi:hypothetical protein
MMIFLFILTVGFVYEWKKGALDWDWYDYLQKKRKWNTRGI